MPQVYTLSTLQEAAEAGARLAVLGQPIHHSLSPELHQPALDAHGLDYSYIRLEVEPGQLAEAFARMAELDFIGCNCTVPHKFEAIETCHRLDPHAQRLGSVNTVLFQDDEYLGFNTDGPGFVKAIQDSFSIDVRDLRILIIGAGGGAGQAIATQCAFEGCERLVLANRTVSKIDALQSKLAPLMEDTRVASAHDRIITLANDDPRLFEEANDIDLIVNTTSLGLKSSDSPPVPAKLIQAHHLVYDTIYKPNPTTLLANAQARGARTANGLTMLLHQGILAYKIWHPNTDPASPMKKALGL